MPIESVSPMNESINLVTNDGHLRFTNVEIDYLKSFLVAHDRGGYYMALYNMTGSQEALLQAEISMFSGPAGGAAYLGTIGDRPRFSGRI